MWMHIVCIYYLYSKHSFTTCYGNEHYDTTHQKNPMPFLELKLWCIYSKFEMKMLKW